MKSDRIRKPSRAKEKGDAQSGYFGSNPQRWLAIQLAGSSKNAATDPATDQSRRGRSYFRRPL